MPEEESLVSRRPKRCTAGNRMELALAELAPEEPQDPEEDVDFIIDRALCHWVEEEDVFESDFASTDEEAAQEDVDEGDKTMMEEERRVRKTARARVEKATAAAHARQRVTFNPEATPSQPKIKLTQKPKRRVSLGVVVNAETGEVIEGGAGTAGVKRHSQRRHTVMNTSATVNRIKDAEEKRVRGRFSYADVCISLMGHRTQAAIPKKTKMATRLPTQDELIARALDTEEGNITEHRDYLRVEEEKRAKARVVKQAIEGPVLRWVSKKETIQVEVQPPPPPPPLTTAMGVNSYAAKYNLVYTSGVGAGTIGSQAYSMPFYTYAPLIAQSAASKPQEASASVTASSSYLSRNPEVSPAVPSTVLTSVISHSTPVLSSTSSSNIEDPIARAVSPVPSVPSQQQQPQQSQTQLQTQPPAQPPAQSQTSAQPQPPPALFPYLPIPTTPLITHRSEDVCKNYVIHELTQSIPSNPTWKDTMSAMFGDHVQWDELRVFTGKGRPLGQPAKYCDPRTNVPFANVTAYDVLTRLFGRGYVWCSALGCYVGVDETSRRGRSPGGEAEGGGNAGAGVVEDVAGGKEGGNVEGEVEEERTTKRRRVVITDG
ncbi:YL1 nuclear protein-domain-containing protein [Lanmaoa asiatica]|nr:YL1 nuclear protein-domain-containing protein [Lanmaoa asiatica]